MKLLFFFVLPFAGSHIACQILSHNLLLIDGVILPALIVQGAGKVKFTRRKRLRVLTKSRKKRYLFINFEDYLLILLGS